MVYEANSDDDIYDEVDDNSDNNSDIGSLLGSLIGSRSNSEVDSNEFSQESEKNLKDLDLNEVNDESEDDKTDSVTLVKSKTDVMPSNDQDSDAEISEDIITLDQHLSVLNLNAAEKAKNYLEKVMTEITPSQETLKVVKEELSKHANPVPCEICGELMKNSKGVKLHIAKKHKN